MNVGGQYATFQTKFRVIRIDINFMNFMNVIYLFIIGKKIHQVHTCLKNPKTYNTNPIITFHLISMNAVYLKILIENAFELIYIVTLFGNFIKSQKVSSHQLNFKTNDLVLLFKTI